MCRDRSVAYRHIVSPVLASVRLPPLSVGESA